MSKSSKPFSLIKAGLLNFVGVVVTALFTFMFVHVGFDPSFSISFIGLGMKIAAVVTPIIAVLLIYLSHKKKSYGLSWLGVFLPLIVFMLTFFVAGTIDAIFLTAKGI